MDGDHRERRRKGAEEAEPLPTDAARCGTMIDYQVQGFAQLARDRSTVVATTGAHHRPNRFVPLLSYE